MPRALFLPSLPPFLVITAVLLFSDVAPCSAATQLDGSDLYRKHCSVCHLRASQLRVSKNLLDTLRMPPPGMPAFIEEKVSDADVQVLEAYIRPADGKAPQPGPAPITPQSAAGVTERAVQVPASAGAGTERVSRGGKQARARGSWNRRFARTWTIKGRQNGEVVTFQQLAIEANADNEPEAVLSNALSDHTATVTAFEIAGRKLKIEVTWGWKLNPNYWKIETFDLRLSDDGKKLNGTYALRTSGGQSADSTVWGE